MHEASPSPASFETNSSELFLGYTPLHVLLCTAVAASRGKSTRRTLIVVKDFHDADAFVNEFSRWNDSPFDHVCGVPGAFGIGSKFRRQRAYRQSLGRLRTLVLQADAAHCFTGNDARPESCIALAQSEKTAGAPAGTFIDDGLTSYGALARKRLTLPMRLAAKLAFGSSWEDVNILGTSSRVKNTALMYPQFRRPELRSKPSFAVDGSALKSESFSRLLRAYVGRLGAGAEMIHGLGIVAAIAHSSVGITRPYYVETIRTLATAAQRGGIPMAVKYHPREIEVDYLRLAPFVELLPRGLPLEVIYLLSRNLRSVVCDLSTTLLTARWIAPETKAVTARDWSATDPRAADVLEKTGVLLTSRGELANAVLDGVQ